MAFVKETLAAFPRLPFSARYLSYAVLILAFLGFLDATYLTILHYQNVIPPCSLAHGCETVLTSRYATVAGIPIALVGAGFYVALLVLTALGLQTKRLLFTNLLMLLTGTGLLISAILVYLQAFVLHAFCQYCLTSEFINFLLFDCVWWMWRRYYRES